MHDYTTDITATIFGFADRVVTLVHDFECQVEIECIVRKGELSTACTDVVVDGHSLRNGDIIAQRLFMYVQAKAEAEIEAGGWLWDKVREAEKLVLSGHPNDPDARWSVAE